MFWQAIWFLYFQTSLSAADALLLAVVADMATTVLEVPSGYLADRVGRRITLLIGTAATVVACVLLGIGGPFMIFALAQVFMGLGSAFSSGTDSAFLYDSLLASGREGEVTSAEARAFRFSFGGLALSAATGGVMALGTPEIDYFASAVAAAFAMLIAWQFREPAVADHHRVAHPPGLQMVTILRRLGDGPLAWLFALAVGMYVFSHVPYIFGQPFIRQAMQGIGLATETPAVSGAIVALMMVISIGTSWLTVPMARGLGVARMLIIAVTMQIALIAALALSTHVLVLGFLLLRMVPDALAKPLILASIQPRLESAYRATFLSLQSLIGKLLLAGSIGIASTVAPENSDLSHAALQAILPLYLEPGVLLVLVLVLTAPKISRALLRPE
jgi:MFS family permease